MINSTSAASASVVSPRFNAPQTAKAAKPFAIFFIGVTSFKPIPLSRKSPTSRRLSLLECQGRFRLVPISAAFQTPPLTLSLCLVAVILQSSAAFVIREALKVFEKSCKGFCDATNNFEKKAEWGIMVSNVRDSWQSLNGRRKSYCRNFCSARLKGKISQAGI